MTGILYVVHVTHVIGLALVAFRLSRAMKRNTGGWTSASVLFGLPLIILSQLPAKDQTREWPSWKGWLLRGAVGLGLVLSLVALGESALTRNYGARRVKVIAMSALNADVLSHSGTVLETEAGPFDVETWGRTAFALAAYGAFFGAFMVARPFLRMGVIAVAGFIIGNIVNIVQESILISAYLHFGYRPASMWMFYMNGFALGLFALFWLTVGLGVTSSGSWLHNWGARFWRSCLAREGSVEPEMVDRF